MYGTCGNMSFLNHSILIQKTDLLFGGSAQGFNSLCCDLSA